MAGSESTGSHTRASGRDTGGSGCVPAASARDAGEPGRCEEFRARVWEHYDTGARTDLPWRGTRDPYRVLVSEIMLQQTSVGRVAPKYAEFLAAFPDVEALARAPLEDVLRAWRGLGYNRRALALQRTAQVIVRDHNGHVPDTLEALISLPGVGHATAAQVLAFAFNVGVPFIETNVRSVYLHEFFAGAEEVPDAAILPLVVATLDAERPREWFWALLDYGAYLKATHPNPSRRSRHHTVQGRFEGSNRQLRGRLLAALTDGPGRTARELAEEVGFEPERVEAALAALHSEGLAASTDGRWRIG